VNSSEAEAASRTQAILEERARRLAQPLTQETPGKTIELLHFDLARERYAIQTSLVRRIDRLSKLSPVPGVPPYFAGVINLHGEIVPIVDIGRLLGTPAGDGTGGRRVIILGRERAEFGIIVDRADEISTLRMEALDELASTQIDRPFVRAILHDALVILDGVALLDDSRLYIGTNSTPSSPSQERD
jgi:purine-binding chemotaxis protein CheW